MGKRTKNGKKGGRGKRWTNAKRGGKGKKNGKKGGTNGEITRECRVVLTRLNFAGM